jgi:hypothetical protein
MSRKDIPWTARLRLALARLLAGERVRELDAWERGYRAGFGAAMDQREQR